MFFLSQNNVVNFNGKLTFLEKDSFIDTSLLYRKHILINKLKILGYKNDKERTANSYLCVIMHM